MTKKHYLLLIATIVVVAFFQPFLVLLGNLVVIVGVAAYIYTDLSPEAQDAYEEKITELLQKARSTLRKHSDEKRRQKIAQVKRSRLQRMFHLKKQSDDYAVDITPLAKTNNIGEEKPKHQPHG